MKKNNQSALYSLILVFSSLVILAVAFASPIFSEIKYFLSAAVFLALIAACFLEINYLVLILLFLLPVFAGLEAQQFDISPILRIAGIQGSYQTDLFLVYRVFILFVSAVEILRRKLAILKVPMFYLLLASVLLNIIPFIYSDYKALGMAYYWFFLVPAFGAYFLGYFVFGSKKGYLKILLATLLSSAIPIIFSFKQIIFKEFFYENDASLPRIRSFFDHPNKFGSYLFIILVVYLVLYLAVKTEKKDLRKYFFALFPMAILGVLFLGTFSRTSWVAFSMAVVMISAIKSETRIPVAYIGSAIIFLSMLVGSIRNRILGIFVRQYQDTLSGRMETWDMALFEFQQKPWVGFGQGSFKEIIKMVQGKDTGNFYPHSDAVRFILEGGILGFVSYLIYIISAVFYSFISYWRYPSGLDKIKLLGKSLEINFKLLGFIPFLLFAIMIPYSIIEAPSLDFMYLLYAFSILGSWLGLSNNQKI